MWFLEVCFLAAFFVHEFGRTAALRTATALPYDATANELLFRLLKEVKQPEPTYVQLSGFVFKRRALGASLVFLDIIPCEIPRVNDDNDDSVITTIPPVQALLRREFWKQEDEAPSSASVSSTSSFDIYHKILQPGTYVTLTGRAGPSRIPEQAVVFVTNAQYCLPNSNPQHLRAVLEFVRDGTLSWPNVQNALCFLQGEKSDEAIFNAIMTHTSNETCAALAYRILEGFPTKMLRDPSHLMGASNAQKVALLPPVPPTFVTPPSSLLMSNVSDNSEPLSVAEALQQSRQGGAITVQGWVQNRRRFQQGVTVVELVDDFSTMATSGEVNMKSSSTQHDDTIEIKEQWKERIYCVLHPGLVSRTTGTATPSEMVADMYGNILCAGARVLVHGYLSTDLMTNPINGDEPTLSDDSSTFWVKNCYLLRSSSRPSVIRHILDCLHTGKFDPEEAATSLKLMGGYAQAIDIAQGITDATQRQWMTTDLSRELQGEHSRTARMTPAMKHSLDIFAYARSKYPLEPIGTDFNATTQARKILQSNGTALRSLRKGHDGSVRKNHSWNG